MEENLAIHPCAAREVREAVQKLASDLEIQTQIRKNIKRMLTDGSLDYWLKDKILKELREISILDIIEAEFKRRARAK